MRTKIIGTEKCTHVNKKTGLQDCNKLGRFSKKPMISWNKFDFKKTGRKRAYFQFIHNDGTRHNIESYEDHWLSQIKGHPDEELLRNLNTFQNFCYDSSRLLGKIKKASLRWPLKDAAEERYLVDAMRKGDFKPTLKKYQEYEHDRRLKIYERSQDANDERIRNYRSIEFEKIDELARRTLTAEQLHLLDPDLQRAVIIREVELIKSLRIRLHDKEEILNSYMNRRGFSLTH